MKNKILIFAILIAVSLIAVYKYAYKPKRDISTEKVAVVTNSQTLTSDFSTNDSLANIKYLDKTIEIYGKITTIDLQNKAIILDEKIYVSFLSQISPVLKISDTKTIKGRFIGFDELSEEYRVDQASFKE